MSEEKERECATDSVVYGLKEIGDGNFYLAAFHLENAARSLKEIERIREEEKQDESGKVFFVGRILNGWNHAD